MEYGGKHWELKETPLKVRDMSCDLGGISENSEEFGIVTRWHTFSILVNARFSTKITYCRDYCLTGNNVIDREDCEESQTSSMQ